MRVIVLLSLGLALCAMSCTDWAPSTDGVYTPDCSDPAAFPRGCMRASPMLAPDEGPDLIAVPLIVEESRLIAAAQTSLVAIDLATGARNVMSGDYFQTDANDTSTTESVGSGPPLGLILAMQRAPDGSYDVVNSRADTGGVTTVITRIDPVTGDRRLVDDITSTQCETAGFRLTPMASSGLVITPDGTRYLAVYGRDEAERTGFGVARVSHNDCELVSFVGGAGGGTVGAGHEWRGPLSSLQFARGALWGVDAIGRQLVRIDPASGARTLYPLSSLVPAATALAVNEQGAWSRSTSNGLIELFDPDTGEFTQLRFFSKFPGTTATLNELVADPTRPLLYARSGNAVLVIHRVTGKTNWLVRY